MACSAADRAQSIAGAREVGRRIAAAAITAGTVDQQFTNLQNALVEAARDEIAMAHTFAAGATPANWATWTEVRLQFEAAVDAVAVAGAMLDAFMQAAQ